MEHVSEPEGAGRKGREEGEGGRKGREGGRENVAYSKYIYVRTYVCTVVTRCYFSRFLGGALLRLGGGNPRAPPPLYKTLTYLGTRGVGIAMLIPTRQYYCDIYLRTAFIRLW